MLIQSIHQLKLPTDDRWVWKRTSLGKFTTKSAYLLDQNLGLSFVGARHGVLEKDLFLFVASPTQANVVVMFVGYSPISKMSSPFVSNY